MPHIRPLAEADLPMILAWRNHASIRSMMFTNREVNLDEHRAWFEKASRDPTRRLLIVETSEGPLGFVQFDRVEIGGVSDWGFYARPDAPKGSGQLLGLAGLDYAFSNLNLHKVCGQALAFNHASIGMHRRLGFRQEGLLRDQHRAETAYHSVFHFGLLQPEWSDARGDIMSRTFARKKGPKV